MYLNRRVSRKKAQKTQKRERLFCTPSERFAPFCGKRFWPQKGTEDTKKERGFSVPLLSVLRFFVAKESGRKKAQKTQKKREAFLCPFCVFCAFLWLKIPVSDFVLVWF